MSALQNTPANTNFLQPTKFVLTFKRMPNVRYFCQKINLPGINSLPLEYTTPLVNLPVPGNKLIYDELEVTFLVDEELYSWKEIHDWIRAMAPAKSTNEYNNLRKMVNNITTNDKFPQYSDCTLSILNASNNPKIRINFSDCFPVSLSSIDFDSTKSADDIITAQVALKFSHYDIERL